MLGEGPLNDEVAGARGVAFAEAARLEHLLEVFEHARAAANHHAVLGRIQRRQVHVGGQLAAFEQVVLVHGVRQVNELAYHDYITKDLPAHEFLGEMVTAQLLYYPTVTREPYCNMGRVTDLLESGKLTTDMNLPALNPAEDRVMICGSPGMLKDLKQMLETRGFSEGNTSRPGDFVIERAFAEQ